MRKSKIKIVHRLAAAATVGMMLSESKFALAGAPNATTLADNIVKSSAGFTQLINVLGYVGGSGLAVAGIFKLKQHVDNPAQTAMKDGVMRLASGGALLSLPYMTKVMQGSVGDGGAASVDATSVKIKDFQ